MEKEEVLRDLGLSSLKPKQEEVIDMCLEGTDTFCVLPTGHGKSLLFVFPPLVKDKVSWTLTDSHNFIQNHSS